MPSWICKEESSRRETKKGDSRRSQPHLRKMITVLDRMSKSKRVALKESVLLDQF